MVCLDADVASVFRTTESVNQYYGSLSLLCQRRIKETTDFCTLFCTAGSPLQNAYTISLYLQLTNSINQGLPVRDKGISIARDWLSRSLFSCLILFGRLISGYGERG